MSARSARSIRVEALARVEGEGGLAVRVRDGRVIKAALDIYEPPRFFEAFLRGRRFTEAPDLTARICGICPAAYQMSAVHAMERICGVTVEGALRELRRLLYCGEWIESHALHIVMLHAPDFLGYESGIHMAKDHPLEVTRGLQVKKLGNELMALVGGREIHPINVRVGGFYRVPTAAEMARLVGPLERARDEAAAILRWVAGFRFPDFERDWEMVALRHPAEYPLNEGRIVSSSGLDIEVQEWDRHFVEEHAPHSNALHARLIARGAYHVGPLARYSLNFDRLPEGIQRAAREAGLGPTCRNPFQSIVVRAVELLWAVEEALRIARAYQPPDRPAVPVTPRAGSGWAATEAPRGILVHAYRLDPEGLIQTARIVPPTSQNQKSIEEDLGRFVEAHLGLPERDLTWQVEQAVRNYDPCISCATHFLKLSIERD
jgi:coenzyme F420-reducing hydrogenase alpha subunit